jgi:soluble lytic murein transglycosylase
VNQLWELGLVDQAWDHWRARSETGQLPSYPEQLVEGRLRIAVGEPWMGLDQLFRLSLRWRHPNCQQEERLQRSQSPRLFSGLFQSAAKDQNVSSNLLYGISKQESRFTPDVRSVVGAAGLMQLMPATAAELAGRPLQVQELDDPELNIRLGAAYLKQLLKQWQGHPLLAIASYNAGPGTVGGWRNDELNTAPELWVERIPYPETRYYTKKVMDNLLRYADRRSPGVCEQDGAG